MQDESFENVSQEEILDVEILKYFLTNISHITRQGHWIKTLKMYFSFHWDLNVALCVCFGQGTDSTIDFVHPYQRNFP